MTSYEYLNMLYKESQFIKNTDNKYASIIDFLLFCEIDTQFKYILFSVPLLTNDHKAINSIFKWFCLKENSGHILNLLANDTKFKIDDDSMNSYHPSNYMTILNIRSHRIETQHYFNDFSNWYEEPLQNDYNLFT